MLCSIIALFSQSCFKNGSEIFSHVIKDKISSHIELQLIMCTCNFL